RAGAGPSPRSVPFPTNAPSRPDLRQAPSRFSSGPAAALVVAPAHRVEQPGAGIGPVAVGRPPCDPEGPGRFLLGQPGEEAELDQLRARRLLGRQAVKRLVESEQVQPSCVARDLRLVELDPTPVPAPLAPS